MTATHAGEFMGIPATGRRVTLAGIDISRIEDGRIAEHWIQCDMLGFLEQLGAIPTQDAGGRAR
jgi:predicted ester cyclase